MQDSHPLWLTYLFISHGLPVVEYISDRIVDVSGPWWRQD
jgi:ABC-type glutathione transport system ATPase component